MSLVLSHIDPDSHPFPVGSTAFLPDLRFGGVDQGSLVQLDFGSSARGWLLQSLTQVLLSLCGPPCKV